LIRKNKLNIIHSYKHASMQPYKWGEFIRAYMHVCMKRSKKLINKNFVGGKDAFLCEGW